MRAAAVGIALALSASLLTAVAAGAKPVSTREALRELERIAPGMMNATCPLPGVATGGQPGEADFARLAQAGYRAIVDFRDSSEARGFDEVKSAREAGLEYVIIPVRPGRLGSSQFDAFRELMRDEQRRPILVHCHSGNRVGAMMIPYLVLDRRLGEKKVRKMVREMGMRPGQFEQVAWEYVRERRRAAGE